MPITKNKKLTLMHLMSDLGVIGAVLLGFCCMSTAVIAADQVVPPKHSWSFAGPLGTYDRAALQRGFQVYKEVCSTCHSMHQLSYRNLSALGFSKAEVKAIARAYEVPGGVNDEGEAVTKQAEPHDRFFKPYANDQMARSANNGALPPDLSLITKARAHGADYVRALLIGYEGAPAGFALTPGMYYNKYFPGSQIAMIPPLKEGLVSYSDGTKATVDQMATDVVTFLAWAAEPEMEERKQLGVRVLIFLGVFFAFMFALYKRTWRSIKK